MTQGPSVVHALVCSRRSRSSFADVSHARTTNTAQLDNGTCGRNLQLGSDKTASSSATPSFFIAGDGGLSTYQAFIDGASIGTFASDGFANVCIYDTIPLADGPHVADRATSSRPHASLTVTPFNFSVDTVPPAQPSTPVISGFSDSGLPGRPHHEVPQRRTSPASPTRTSRSSSTTAVTLLGGAQGRRHRRLVGDDSQLADGNYIVTAVALDQAGNKSPLSLVCPADDRRHRLRPAA